MSDLILGYWHRAEAIKRAVAIARENFIFYFLLVIEEIFSYQINNKI
jgi:hypothetical protein